MAEEKKEEKKIIIDEGWKQEAQREKEKLAAEEATEKAEKGGGRRPPLPKGDLAGLVSMLVMQTFYALGAIKLEGQEEKEPDLELARYNIDMLEMIKEKTKGNLTKPEEKMLETTLSEVRMVFVKASE